VSIAVAATGSFGAGILDGLAARREIELLLTKTDSSQGRGRKKLPPPAKEIALAHDLVVQQPDRLSEFPGNARIVIVADYGVLIPEKLLADRLWLNVHPSLLPRWRGPAPVERAIMEGDRETGVTIHRTTAELDTGPIAAQRRFPIGPEDDAGVVFERATRVALHLSHEVLASMIGVTRVTVTREIGALIRDGIVGRDKRHLIVRQPERLLERAQAS